MIRRKPALRLLFLAAALGACAPPGKTSQGSTDAGAADTSAIACSPDAPGLAESFRRIDSLLTEARRTEEIPGLAAGVVCGDTLIWARGYGVMAVDDSTPVTPETLFRIASLTKLFTATAAVKLAESRALDLDDPVREHLPWFELQRPAETGEEPVSIRQLLTHTAGMPRDSRLTDFARLYQPGREQAIAALPEQSLEAPPGESYAYSNLGYGILGEVIAAAADTTYAGYLEEEILEPLGMTGTLVHPTREDRTAWGHGPRGAEGSRPKAGFWELGFATPAGGMASSVAELSEFIELNLAPYVGAEPAILSAGAIRDMHRLQFTMNPTRGGSGLGWGIEISSDQHVVYHGGELPEQTAFLLIDLKNAIGVVLLSNAQDVDASALAQEMLRMGRAAVLGPESEFPVRAIPPG